MRLFSLFLKSRISLPLVIAFSATQLGGASLGLIQRSEAGLMVDLSIFSAVAVPGFLTSLILLIGISQIPEMEAEAEPIPISMTLATILLLAVLSASFQAMFLDAQGTEYQTSEVMRNYCVFLAIGLLPGFWNRWVVGPALVSALTITVLGAYGITRSESAFGLIVATSESRASLPFAIAAAVTISGMLVLLRVPAIRHKIR